MIKKKDIEFLRVSYLPGPNIWTYRPVIEAWVDIGALEDFPSNTLPGLYQRLTAMLPNLVEHRCGVGARGGFLERLQEGTYCAHILEHVVLELQNLAGMRTGFGKTRQISDNGGIYKMAFRTRQEQVGRAALVAGRALLMAAIEDRPFDLEAGVAALTDQVEALCLGPSTAHIVDAATARAIPALRLTDGNLVQLGHGARSRRIWTAETEHTSAIAEGIASDKDLTKSLLAACGVPVPEGQLATSAPQAWQAACEIGLPVVVKPYDGNHGRGVSVNLHTEADVEAAYHLASRKGGGASVIVERFIVGNEHRLLVVGQRLVAAARGESLWVTGDGTSNIIELVDLQINTDPRRGTTEEAPLNAVAPEHGAEIILELARQGLTARSVPSMGTKVLIQPNGNVAVDVTDFVHPSTVAMATLAARIVGLDIAGIDLVAEDIAQPLEQQGGALIEVNASPGLLAHIKPASGPARPVGAAIVGHLFEPEQNGRIPIVGIAGSRNTTLIARLVAWLLQVGGQRVGLACNDGLYLGSRRLAPGPSANWEAGQRLLLNRNVEAAVFENSNRMILAQGLAYDKCAVGIVTDVGAAAEVAEFHIHSDEQAAQVVRTQVDVILPSGVAVLNGADRHVAALAPLCDGSVIFYGVGPQLTALDAHRLLGHRVVLLRDGNIVLATGEQETVLLPLASLKPAQAAQGEAVLAAAAAGWALGLAPELIGAGLRTFDLNPRKNHC